MEFLFPEYGPRSNLIWIASVIKIILMHLYMYVYAGGIIRNKYMANLFIKIKVNLIFLMVSRRGKKKAVSKLSSSSSSGGV